jgi:hypothetical protein
MAQRKAEGVVLGAHDGQRCGKGLHGYAVFTANPRILLVKHEREAVETHGTQIFCIAKPDGTREARAYIYGRHILSIIRRTRKPGACFWRRYHGQHPISYDINQSRPR